MKPEVVEGARNLRLILTSDARPAVLAGLNLSQEELMLRLCNDVMDADLEIKGLEERLRHTVDYSVSLKKANTELDMLKAMLQQVRNELATANEGLAEQGRRLAAYDSAFAHSAIDRQAAAGTQTQAFTPLAAALAKSPWKERRKKPKKARR